MEKNFKKLYTCSVCNEDIAHNHIKNHLKNKHDILDVEKYYNDSTENPIKTCLICNKETKFINLNKGYSKWCSHSCACKSQWIEADDRREKTKINFFNNKPVNPGRTKGSKNINSYPMTDKVKHRIKMCSINKTGKPGHPHSQETKDKMRDIRIKFFENGGKVVGTYKGKFKPKNPKKYKGDPTEIVYRSSWELQYMMQLDSDPSIIEWSSEELSINYKSPKDNRAHRYFPDFLVKKKTDKGVIEFLVEIKPKAQTMPPKVQSKPNKRYLNEVMTWGVNSAKWKAAEAYCKTKGWDFIILTEDHLKIVDARKPKMKSPLKKPPKNPWGKFK